LEKLGEAPFRRSCLGCAFEDQDEMLVNYGPFEDAVPCFYKRRVSLKIAKPVRDRNSGRTFYMQVPENLACVVEDAQILALSNIFMRSEGSIGEKLLGEFRVQRSFDFRLSEDFASGKARIEDYLAPTPSLWDRTVDAFWDRFGKTS